MLIQVLIVLLVVGFILWLINTYATFIDSKVKQLINIVVIVILVIWLLKIFGLLSRLP